MLTSSSATTLPKRCETLRAAREIGMGLRVIAASPNRYHDSRLHWRRFGGAVAVTCFPQRPTLRNHTLSPPTPKTRRLGSQGLETLPVGLGCKGMSEFYE